MIKLYDELTEEKQDELANAWVKICDGLIVYGQITGAASLDDMIYEALWDEIEQQKSEQVVD